MYVHSNQVVNSLPVAVNVVMHANDLCRLLPTVIVLLLFGALAGYSHLVNNANECSCWCLPVYGNVLPLANATPTDNVRGS